MNEDAKSESAIAVILDAPPQIHLIPKDAAGFEFSGEHFEDVGLGMHNGFYDFLRSRTGRILGLRFSPDSDAEALLTGLPGRWPAPVRERGSSDSTPDFLGNRAGF